MIFPVSLDPLDTHRTKGVPIGSGIGGDRQTLMYGSQPALLTIGADGKTTVTGNREAMSPRVSWQVADMVCASREVASKFDTANTVLASHGRRDD